MSAQAVFAIAATVAPAAPQGPAGTADATGFAALVVTATDTEDGSGAPSDSATASAPADGQIKEAAQAVPTMDATASLLTLPAPPPPPPSSMLPPEALQASAATPLAPLAAGDAPSTEPPPAAPRVPADVSAQAPQPSRGAEQGVAKGNARLEPTAPVQTANPAAEASGADEAPPVPAQVKAEPPAAAGAAPPLPAPAPLRPLAERTSKPTEPGTGEAVSNLMSGPKDRAAGFTTPPAGGLVADKASGAAGGRSDAAPVTAEIGEDAATSEAGPAYDSVRQSDAAATIARETGLSGLSRSTIEATAQIAAQILRRLEGRSTRFEMALLPEELGRVDIKLDIDSEGRLAARLAFDNPAAATDLRGRVDELRRQLEDAGFHLADDAFEFADRDSSSSAFDRGQDDRGGSKRAFAAAQRLNAEADAAIPPRWMALSLSPSGVDVKV
jgi:flagellar hook-length control protein FliK